MKVRKKPVVVEAVQWWPGVVIEGITELVYDPGDGSTQASGRASISTLEGVMIVNAGDWVITGVKGEKYPCKPDIFEATYEPVKPDPLAAPVWPGNHGEEPGCP